MTPELVQPLHCYKCGKWLPGCAAVDELLRDKPVACADCSPTTR